MTIAEGTQFGPYRLLEKIGAGGMGEVYRVLDTRLEREVALKLVSDSYLIADLGSGSPHPPRHPRSSHTPLRQPSFSRAFSARGAFRRHPEPPQCVRHL